MIEELKEVVLLRDLPDQDLRAGDVGVIVEVFPGRDRVPPGYMVEFITLTGETVAVVDVTADAVRPVGEGNMPQARSMARSRYCRELDGRCGRPSTTCVSRCSPQRVATTARR